MFENDYFTALAAVTCIKFLFIPLYHSTDFEVHRNWMAITHTRSVKDWYLEATSQWTLDYPPLFAWFEFILSHIAKYFDPQMLDIKNMDYNSPQTVFFLRFSVILSDAVYVYAVYKIYNLIKQKLSHSDDPWIKPEVIFAMLLLWNPGLLLVDHIHFQYNGFLNGLLFLSITGIMQERYLEAALWYTLLLNFKHLYLYFAPAYFIFLLKTYCFKKHGSGGNVNLKSFSVVRFFQLTAVVCGVCIVSLGPFLFAGQWKELLGRIFPVKRGLTHSYWAPNFWALYNFVDRIIYFAVQYFTSSDNHQTTSITKGLVEEYQHSILPSIGVEITVILTLISIFPALWIVWKRPKSSCTFMQSLVICSFGSFLFGYHVHEKAILMVTLPLTLIAVSHQEMAEIYIFLSTVGHFALFPLLHQAAETPIKVILLLLHTIYAYTSLGRLYKVQKANNLNIKLLSTIERSFFVGIPLLQVFYSFGLNMLKLEDKLPFLPLMLISTYCAIGVLYSWVKYCSCCLKMTRCKECFKQPCVS